MGCMGLPVFTGWSFGALSLIGPTGGYFLGFVIQAFFVGWILERQTRFNSLLTCATLILSCAMNLALAPCG